MNSGIFWVIVIPSSVFVLFIIFFTLTFIHFKKHHKNLKKMIHSRHRYFVEPINLKELHISISIPVAQNDEKKYFILSKINTTLTSYDRDPFLKLGHQTKIAPRVFWVDIYERAYSTIVERNDTLSFMVTDKRLYVASERNNKIEEFPVNKFQGAFFYQINDNVICYFFLGEKSYPIYISTRHSLHEMIMMIKIINLVLEGKTSTDVRGTIEKKNDSLLKTKSAKSKKLAKNEKN